MPGQRDDRDVGRAAADVDDHVAGRLGHGQARTNRRGHGLVDEVNLARLDAEAAVLHRAALDRRDLRRHADDQPRPHQRPLAVHLPDEVREHLLGGVEVGDHPVPHRPHRRDVGGRPAEHLVGLRSHGLDLAVGGVERHDGGLVEDDAAAAGEDTGVGGAEVDRDVRCERREQIHVTSLERPRGINRSRTITCVQRPAQSKRAAETGIGLFTTDRFPGDEI